VLLGHAKSCVAKNGFRTRKRLAAAGTARNPIYGGDKERENSFAKFEIFDCFAFGLPAKRTPKCENTFAFATAHFNQLFSAIAMFTTSPRTPGSRKTHFSALIVGLAGDQATWHAQRR
jgi:hypothetical protein